MIIINIIISIIITNIIIVIIFIIIIIIITFIFIIEHIRLAMLANENFFSIQLGYLNVLRYVML